MYALANGMLDHPTLTALPPEQRRIIEQQVSTEFTQLANNLVRERAMQPIPLIRALTTSSLVRLAYSDIIQEEQGDLESMRDHLAITIQTLDDPDLSADIIEELRANRRPERLTQLREMLEAHMDAVLTAIDMNEAPHELLNIGNFEPDTQHGANQPAQLPAPAPQTINAAITQAYTEPLQLATTPVSHSMMQAAIEHVNTMANNMFGQGYTPSEIAQSAIYRLTNVRNDVARLRPEVLRINRAEYDDYLSMLRRAIDDLGPYTEQQAQLPAPVPAEPTRPIHELYAELVDAIGNAIEEGSFEPDMYDNVSMSEAIRNGEVGGELNEATPEELRLLADYVERNGFAPGNAPAQQAQLPAPVQQHIANANVLPRRIQTASLTQLNGELSTRMQDEVRELADEAAHPNNANTPRDLRQLVQMVRQYSAGQPWEDFNHVQRELLARALEQHATDIEIQQRPPGHKKGGYITRKPSIDEMRFALMKGK
jgi:hypothetical protein